MNAADYSIDTPHTARPSRSLLIVFVLLGGLASLTMLGFYSKDPLGWWIIFLFLWAAIGIGLSLTYMNRVILLSDRVIFCHPFSKRELPYNSITGIDLQTKTVASRYGSRAVYTLYFSSTLTNKIRLSPRLFSKAELAWILNTISNALTDPTLKQQFDETRSEIYALQ